MFVGNTVGNTPGFYSPRTPGRASGRTPCRYTPTDETAESETPFLSDAISDVSSNKNGWLTGTKLALGLTGAVFTIGTVISAVVGAGNPITGIVALGVAAGLLKEQPSPSVVTEPETLPVPARQVGNWATTESLIDIGDHLVALTTAMLEMSIDEISPEYLQRVNRKIERVSSQNLETLTLLQLHALRSCFGTNLMGKISSLITHLENAQSNIIPGNTRTIGSYFDRIFSPVGIDAKLIEARQIRENIQLFTGKIQSSIDVQIRAIRQGNGGGDS